MIFKRKNIQYTLLSDEQLMERLQNGEVKAFDSLYRRYNDRLLYYFYRMLGSDKTIAEDFLQETFYKILNKPHLFNTKKKFSTWIFSIAHNMCKNEYRNRDIRSIVICDENTDRFTTAPKLNDESFDINIIFKSLEALDESHKTVFLLKYREGFSIDEISDIMDLPKGTVKSRIHYTKQYLKKELQPVYNNLI